MSLDIGDYSRMVRVVAPAIGQDDAGQPLDGHADVCTAWANIRYQSGAEAIRGGALSASAAVSIRLWGYRTDLHAGMRVLDITDQGAAPTVYEITGHPLPDMANGEHVDLVCEVRQ